MAAGDYRSCDVCGCKTFYDVNLNYDDVPNEYISDQVKAKEAGEPGEWGYYLERLGDWAVICKDCAKTHKTQIVPIDA